MFQSSSQSIGLSLRFDNACAAKTSMTIDVSSGRAVTNAYIIADAKVAKIPLFPSVFANKLQF